MSKIVDGYKKIENTIVDSYKKVEDKFVDTFLKKDGETIEEAKKRLQQEQHKYYPITEEIQAEIKEKLNKI